MGYQSGYLGYGVGAKMKTRRTEGLRSRKRGGSGETRWRTEGYLGGKKRRQRNG